MKQKKYIKDLYPKEIYKEESKIEFVKKIIKNADGTISIEIEDFKKIKIEGDEQ